MPIISAPVRAQAAARLARLPNPVRLVVFTQQADCRFCRENRELAEELAGLSSGISVEVHDLLLDKVQAAAYAVDRVPAVCVAGEHDHGIRFYGVPTGFEFNSLLSAVEVVAKRDSGLSTESRQRLSAISGSLDIQVFTTLTCPVCPAVAMLAHRLAFEHPGTIASVIDSAEFAQLAGLYNVTTVPKTVVNRRHAFDGALPEDRFVDEVLKGAELPAG